MDTPSLEVSNSRWDRAWKNLGGWNVALPMAGLGMRGSLLRGPSKISLWHSQTLAGIFCLFKASFPCGWKDRPCSNGVGWKQGSTAVQCQCQRVPELFPGSRERGDGYPSPTRTCQGICVFLGSRCCLERRWECRAKEYLTPTFLPSYFFGKRGMRPGACFKGSHSTGSCRGRNLECWQGWIRGS